MKHQSFKEIPLEPVTVEGAKGAHIRWLIGQKDGAPNFAMRMFEVDVDGHTPYHTHNYEHLVFILDGKGVLKTKDGEKPMSPWDAIYVDPNIEHQFINTGDTALKFLCSIPHEPNKPAKKNPFSAAKANTC